VRVSPQTPAEKVVWSTLIWTWPFYGLGALYVVGPVLGWTLAAMVGLSLYLGPAIRSDMQATGPVPALAWVWSAGMLVMLVALWAGHADWNLGTTKTIKSSIGWAKGWALIPVFILSGAILPIRRELLVRGHCVLGLWTLCLLPLLLVAPYVGLPHLLFTSPLKAVGGPGPEYFSVYLYTIDPASETPRWQFFAPWSPFAALLGVCMVLFALEEKHRRWKIIGLAAGVLMIVMSKSRMGLVGLVFCSMSPRLLPLIARSLGWIFLSASATAGAVWGAAFVEVANRALHSFKSARADSTRVRETLQRIAYERWKSDAMIFGHGTVRPGAHLVEYMPIGSHHTWYGLLFVKGLTGFAAFLIPFLTHLFVVTLDSIKFERGKLPLGLLLTILLQTFGENVEIQTYLLWPPLLMLGRHLREMATSVS